MGLLSRLRARLGGNVTFVFHGLHVPAVQGMGPDELYRTQPALRAVVGFLAQEAGSLPLKCYERRSDTDRRRVTDGPAATLSRPNPWTTAHDLSVGTFADMLLYGWALWYVYPSDGSPGGHEIVRLPVPWVTDTPTTDGFAPSEYVVQNPETGRAPVRIPARNCVRFSTYDPSGTLAPRSPVEALRQVLSEQMSAWRFRNGVWANGGRVSAVLTRPAGEQWSPEARKRFIDSWRERYSGERGDNTGGTPLLEDGMDLKTVQFNAREAQWREATTLAREDVAAVYRVNPALIWHTDGQTYASAKDNARALYADTLAPYLNGYSETVNAFALPLLGAAPDLYAEFDLSAKLAGSFEEQATVLSQSVGGPWMTRNEARARQNLPEIEGGDELIVPLNVLEGGLASPHDTDPAKGAPDAPESRETGANGRSGIVARNYAKHAADGCSAAPAAPVERKSLAAAPRDAEAEVEGVLARFAERQSRRVLADMAKAGAADAKDAGDDDPDWWDRGRWDRELADDLAPVFQSWATYQALSALSDLGLPRSLYGAARTVAFTRAMAEARARAYNAVTLAGLAAVWAGTAGTGKGSTAEGVFEMARTTRARRSGASFATSVAAFGTTEAVRQAAPRDTDAVKRTKTWRVRSHNPRPTHARMDGETVGLDEKFSNGADWPGDDVLGPAEVCNCRCRVEVHITGEVPEVRGMGERERMYGVRYEDAMRVDTDYIGSDGYAAKFDGLTGSDEIDGRLLAASRRALTRNSGTSYESMTLVDMGTGESVTVDSEIPDGIAYTTEVRDFIDARRAGKPTIAAVHNHPNGTPPSADDLSKMAENNYAIGVVAGHNGQVYTYDYHGPALEKGELDAIAEDVSSLCDMGYDVDRAFRAIFSEHGLDYELR